MGPGQMKRLVLDTNVVVSGLLFGGEPGKLVELWKQKRIHPLFSREIIEEYLKVLAYPRFRLTESDIQFLLAHEILPCFEVVTVAKGMPFVKRDPSDDKFIWCAQQGKAEAIVSGDGHLLALKKSPVPIMSVPEFLKQMKKIMNEGGHVNGIRQL
ncbi:MAG: putative toxin-antitoxin system toxin component, PIN family [Pseudomonadota bacterium]